MPTPELLPKDPDAVLDDSDWELPNFEVNEYSPKTSSYCIVSAAWDEGEKSYRQYRKMRSYTKDIDFIVANRGDELTSLGSETLSAEFQINTLLQVNEAGQSKAHRVALAYALRRDYDGIVMIDSNGKDDVDRIPKFISKLREGYDFVQGSRFMPGGHQENTPLFRIFAIRVIGASIIKLGCGYWYSDLTNGFKGFSPGFLLDTRVKPFRDVFNDHNLLVYINYAAARCGVKIIEIPTSRVYPKSGPIASKLTSLSQIWNLFLDFIKAAMGLYNPAVKR